MSLEVQRKKKSKEFLPKPKVVNNRGCRLSRDITSESGKRQGLFVFRESRTLFEHWRKTGPDVFP